jgi:hypothetical protein
MADGCSDGAAVSPRLVTPWWRRPTATSAGLDPAPKGGECFVEGGGDAGHIPVVDETAVELAAQLAEEAGPVVVPGRPHNRLRCGSDDDPLDDLHGGADPDHARATPILT